MVNAGSKAVGRLLSPLLAERNDELQGRGHQDGYESEDDDREGQKG
jgi:hypothetical protein